MVMFSVVIKVRSVAKGVLAAMCVIMLLQCTDMMNDTETVEDREKGSVAEVTDDSCTVEFIEIVPLDRTSDDYYKLELVDPVAVISPEDLQDLNQEMADGYIREVDKNCSVKQEPADETLRSLQQVSFVTPLILRTVIDKYTVSMYRVAQ